ncbi:MAG: hypothetical protein H7Y02_01485, partial [Candidatus Obscuribacterales bacterium]|nr:hypothetical protein [Steroidobacteraceae bacterium]
MTASWARAIAVSCTAMASLATLPAFAAHDESSDPPDRVGRVEYVQGDVSLRLANNESPDARSKDSSDWSRAGRNQPLTVGDEIWTDRNARAAIDLGVATLRLDEHTNVALRGLRDRDTRV